MVSISNALPEKMLGAEPQTAFKKSLDGPSMGRMWAKYWEMGVDGCLPAGVNVMGRMDRFHAVHPHDSIFPIVKLDL